VKSPTTNVRHRVPGRTRPSTQWICRGIACLALIAAASNADTPGFTRSQWADLLRARLPSLICREHWYVRQCFSVSETECGSTVTSAFDACLKQYSNTMPLEIRSKEESAEWGKTITSCLGVRFEKVMIRHKKSSTQCANPGIW
jgi:hypothetical protein